MGKDQLERKLAGVIGIHHIGMSVSNLQSAIEFYADALKVSAVSLENGPVDSVDQVDSALLKFPNGYLKLSEYDRTDIPSSGVLPVAIGPGITHVCYQSPTSEDIFRRLMDSGATSVSRGESPFIYWARVSTTLTLEISMESL